AEEPQARHVGLDLDRLHGCQRPRIRKARQELGRRLVDVRVGRLRRQDDGADELEGSDEVELAVRRRVLLRQTREGLRRDRWRALEAIASLRLRERRSLLRSHGREKTLLASWRFVSPS